jgi:hypothetical protein
MSWHLLLIAMHLQETLLCIVEIIVEIISFEHIITHPVKIPRP